MYCRALACDFDGTCATDGHLAPEMGEVLAAARADGVSTLLVTGRVLPDLRHGEVDFGQFDVIVAENGAIVWFPATGRTITLGSPPSDRFLGRLRSEGVPFHVGEVIVGAWEEHAGVMLRLVREEGADLQLVFNRAAVMLLPTGVNKAAGVRRALAELGRSARNLVAFGDAENDLPLFALAQVGVAPRGSVPAIVRIADDRLSQPGPAGVAQFLSRLRDAAWLLPTPPRHALRLGRTAAGAAVELPLAGNVLISGDPRSGKSWVGGLVVERLVEAGYAVCIIDPEGDHATLGERPGMMVLGRELPLPAPEAIPLVLRHTGCSIVVTLAGLSPEARRRYACVTLEALERERRSSGLPHWIVVDEAQYFFAEGARCCAGLVRALGNLVLLTYRPSLLAESVHESMTAHLLTRTVVEDERYFVDGLLRAEGPRGLAPSDALTSLGTSAVGLLRRTPEGPRWDVFTPAERSTRHVHHQRKYANTSLPSGKGFAFRLPHGSIVRVAQSVREFCEAVAEVPLDCLQHHLVAGDFSRWSRDVLGDAPLAGGLAKLEDAAKAGAAPRRDEIVGQVEDRYVTRPEDRPVAVGE